MPTLEVAKQGQKIRVATPADTKGRRFFCVIIIVYQH